MYMYISALQNHTYEVSGRILAYSMVHRGPLPSFLSETLYTAITKGNEAAFPGIEDVDDVALQGQLKAVS